MTFFQHNLNEVRGGVKQLLGIYRLLKQRYTSILYVLKTVISYDKRFITCYFLSSINNSVLAAVEVYIPTVILSIAVKESSLEESFVALCVICSGVLVLSLFQSLLDTSYKKQCSLIRTDLFEILLLKKRFKLRYDLSENPDVLNLAEKAKAITWSSNIGVEATLINFKGLFENIFILVELAVMCMTISAYVFPAMIFFSLAEFLLESKIKKKKIKISDEQIRGNRVFAYYSENLGDPSVGKEVRTTKLKEWLISKCKNILNNIDNLEIQKQKEEYKLSSLSAFYSGVSLLFVYMVLIIVYIKKGMTSATFVLLLGATTEINNCLRRSISHVTNLIRYTECFESYETYMKLPEDIFESNLKQTLHPVRLSSSIAIEFKDVTYQYPGAKTPCINNLSFTVHTGEKIAIIGPNGAGKSTIIKLLTGLIKPSKGIILVDGIKTSDHQDLQAFFSPLFQDINQYALSLEENVALMKSYHSDRLNKALEKADLQCDYRKFKEAGNYYLRKDYFENGINLSGGQTQKLAFARAVYKNAPILLLDEPTNSLDPLSEKKIFENYNSMLSDKTTIFISHRLNSTKFCDRVFYVEDGHILEQGSPKELMKRNGKYAELFHLQARRFEGE